MFFYANVCSAFMYLSFCKCGQCTDISNRSVYVLLKVLRTSLLLLFMRVFAKLVRRAEVDVY